MLEKMVIEGGRPLEGSLAVSGAKNAVLPILCASLLATGPCEISNVPKLADVGATCHLLSHLGAKVERIDGAFPGADSGQRVQIDPSGTISPEAPYDIVRRMRASVLVLGPLVARLGQARVSLPGGCAIGERPIDQHLKGLEAMGAVIELKGGYVEARAERLRGARIVLDIPTVTGTENLMMAATLAEGTTFIENAAREPEIVDLADFLIALGAKIKGAGGSVIEIEGVEALGQAKHQVIPDRIETGTYMVAAAITGGDIRLTGTNLSHLDALVDKLRAAGVGIETQGKDVLVSGPRVLQPVNIRTSPFPGFPTDMQAQFMTLMTLAEGASTVVETLFENRFMHVPELRRMGAEIELHGNTASVKGVRRLGGAQVMATDLRASASLVLAGLAARGTTEVLRIYHLDRGYEALDQKLRAIGARVERQSM